MTPYKFVSWPVPEKPETEITCLLEAWARSTPDQFTRDEKDRIARLLSGNDGVYKLAGWCWNMRDCMSKFVVDFGDWGLSYHYAPDKTSLRRALRGCGKIHMILEVPKKK